MHSRMTEITVYLPESKERLLRKEAKERRVSRNEILRQVIDKGMGIDDSSVPFTVKNDIDRLMRLAFDQARKLRQKVG